MDAHVQVFVVNVELQLSVPKAFVSRLPNIESPLSLTHSLIKVSDIFIVCVVEQPVA